MAMSDAEFEAFMQWRDPSDISSRPRLAWEAALEYERGRTSARIAALKQIVQELVDNITSASMPCQQETGYCWPRCKGSRKCDCIQCRCRTLLQPEAEKGVGK